MFKEYIYFGSQTQTAGSQNIAGVDLMSLTSYIRFVGENRVRLTGPGFNFDVYMTVADFEEFQIHLKTAHRLKRVYE